MAMMRSLTEVNQFLPAVCDRRTDGTTNYWFDDRDAIEWWMNATISSEDYVLPNPSAAMTHAEKYSGLVSDDIADDVRTGVERIASAGHEVIVVNQTRPDLVLSVVKVMSPGLRHFWRRLGKGRLYSAPVSMNRRTSQLSEEELNPRSIFF
jgi:ribosomal protein S12 methylthiotransferase accessory factor